VLVELTANVVEDPHIAVTTGGKGGAVDRRLASTLGTVVAWPATRGLVLAAEEATGPANSRFASHNAAVDSLTALILHVGDESNLTLDPGLDTYYLMDTLQFRLPFVAGIGRDPDDEAIVEMVLSLAKALNLEVVAEGVETAGPMTRLRQLGCRYLQGFHFGRPMPVEQTGDLLRGSEPRALAG
jgi:hypothetical protein